MHAQPPAGPDDETAPTSASRADEATLDLVGSLSPSRAGDFLSCPLLYRFRTIDRLPEPPSPAAARGTLVHRVLELLFDVGAAERTPERARAMLRPTWELLQAEEPELASLFTEPPAEDARDAGAAAEPDDAEDGAKGGELESWLATCTAALLRYFDLEDPRRLEPAERETFVEAVTDARLLIRGVIDRVDITADGAVRIVDYKTGRSPGEVFEASALFQLKFYALAWWRTRGVVPTMLQLVYLGNGEILRYQPDVADLVATERKIEAIWRAIEHATLSGDWRPRPSRLCDWCAHQASCPAQGGTAPPLPPDARVLPVVERWTPARPADPPSEAPTELPREAPAP